MAYVDDPNKKQQTQSTMNVLQPSAQGTDPNTQPSQAPQQASGGGSSNTIQSAPSPKRQQPASSGTFTNLQQYNQANQGGAQRMTQAATQNVAQQGKQIQQQAGQQAAKTDSDIAANQAKIAQEQQFAQQQLQSAGQADMSDDDYNRFRNIVTGQTQFNDVRDLDLSQQRVQAQQLQQLGQQAGTDQGRLDLLRQTLGRGKEYTRGQSGLDAAIVAQDAQARQGLQQGVQQTAEQANQALQGVTGDVSARRQALDRLNREYGSNIAMQGDQETTNVMDAVNQGMMDIQSARKILADQLGETEQQADVRLKEMAKRAQSLSSALGTTWGMMMGGITGYGQQIQDLYKDDKEAIGLAGYDTKGLSEAELNRLKDAIYNPNVSLYGNKWANNPFNKNTAFSWDVSWNQGRWAQGLAGKQAGDIAAANAALQKTTGTDALARQLVMQGADPAGVGANELYANLKAGQDINTQTAASREQAQRYQALQDLLKGRGVGDRALSLDQAGKAQEQQALLEQARVEALRKFRLQGQ